MNKIEKELFYLRIYVVLLTIVCAILSYFVVKSTGARDFTEINVERINVVEKDGKLRLVLSNKARQHPGIMDGVTFDERRGQRPPGLMFFNEKGDEAGGLVYDGNSGSGQGGSLTFDKFRGDQTIQLIHDEEPNGDYFSGLKVNDQNMPLLDLIKKQQEIAKLATKDEQDAAYRLLRDQGLLMVERIKLGRDRDKSAVLKLRDANGKVRIELKVEAQGAASLNFLDDAGKILYSLPGAPKK